MRGSIIISFILSLITLESVNAQTNHSIQFNGGLVKPMSSSEGLAGTVQYNYSITKIFEIYSYAGYSVWDMFKIKFKKGNSVYKTSGPGYFSSYSSDEHILIPIYLGGRVNFFTNDLFHSFVNFEIGYSYLSYNSYDQLEVKNPGTGEIEGYHPDLTTRKVNKENLFGIGIGAGLSHPVSSQFNLVFMFKLNSYLNANYHGLFSTRGTYTMFLAGFEFTI